jgi:sialate O-acetylesterase
MTIFLLLAAALLQEPAKLRLPALLSNHMVLQRGTDAPIWGWAPTGTVVNVSASWGASAAVKANAAGLWRATLATPAAADKAQTVWIESAVGSATLTDVLIGEVWVCGGQSNMEWTLGPGVGNGVEGWEQAVAAADLPGIRYFNVPNVVAVAPAEDCQGSWAVCSPQTAGVMSAIGFFYGRALHQELKGVPIGLIGCEWGGTPAEAWTSEEFLAKRGDYKEAVARLQEARTGGTAQPSLEALQKAWWEKLEQTDTGSREKWNRADLDDSAWESVALPGAFDEDLGGFDGVVWYRRTVQIPQDWVQKDLVIELGPIDDCDTFYADSERWGATHQDGAWQTPRKYAIAAKLVDDRNVVLAVRVLDTGGAGGLVGAPESLKIYRQNEPEKSIPLAGEWKMRAGASMADLGAFPRQNWLGPHHPASLYNGMLAPLTNYAMRGAIFYQGESNVGNPEQYATLFPDMVASWRAAWGRGDFPFYWVQIAPYNYGAGELPARLREAQLLALDKIKQGGMAVVMDIGNPRDIHPLKKKEVGERLARWALAGPYERKNLEASGPMLAGFEIKGRVVTLRLSHAHGLKTRDGKAPSHFQIAGADKVFHPAEAKIVGETVVLTSAEVLIPIAARYGWGEADEPNLQNADGLPASSFRTDNWPRP